ncbi:MAG TPA: hypothetical protein VFW52_03135 [Candidatus Saccharimonadales bacterium]|nr:hypothetical protein [Candidatus Saccharimonadales bacterium]
MSDLYVYRKHVRRHWYNKFRMRRRLVAAFALIILIAAAALVIDLIRSDSTQPETSAIQNVAIGDALKTYKTDYFSFQDTGKWVLSKQESTKTKYAYTQFRGVQPQYQLTIYVNENPIPLYSAVPRVLPVRLVNDNSFDITNVYGPCGKQYKPGELHKVKTVTIEGANMLCDPDTPQYSVVLAEVGGDWHLDMKRSNGSRAKYVILYRDVTLHPGADPIIQIADSFKSL